MEQTVLMPSYATGVPDELRQLIHRAIIQVPKRKVLDRELRDSLADPPSLDEFTETIRKAKVNSSADMNGDSYNMLKKLPSELISNLHYCLTRIWQERGIPDWLSDRWLVAIPKK